MSEEVILKIIEGNLAGEEFVFVEEGAYLIGRSPSCALQIANKEDMRISRRHLLLIFDSAHVRIRDLGSHNGTIVNGELLTPGEISDEPDKMTPVDKILKNGDTVSIGEEILTIELISQQPPEIIPLIKKTAPPEVPELSESPKISSPPASSAPPAVPPITPTTPAVSKAPAIPAIPATPPLAASAPPAVVKIPVRPPVPPASSAPILLTKKPAPLKNKINIMDAKTEGTDSEAKPSLKEILDHNVPTAVMDAEEFKHLDDLTLQAPEKKRMAQFKVKGPE